MSKHEREEFEKDCDNYQYIELNDCWKEIKERREMVDDEDDDEEDRDEDSLSNGLAW